MKIRLKNWVKKNKYCLIKSIIGIIILGIGVILEAPVEGSNSVRQLIGVMFCAGGFTVFILAFTEMTCFY